jgi:hypothetical protein
MSAVGEVRKMQGARAGWRLRKAFERVALLTFVLLAGNPLPAAAGDEPQGRVPQPRPDFLFGSPRGWVALRGSWLIPRAEGDLFAFVSDQLTIEKRDFQAPAVIGQVGVALTSRVSLTGDLEFSRKTLASEYRRFIDNLGLPIDQTTILQHVNVEGGVKLALVDPGRSISQLAFIPRAFTPYVGAGVGMFYYDLQQAGDFVDFQTFKVFYDSFRSNGWAPSASVFGGSEIRVWRQLFLDAEGRYVWAKGELHSDFVGFDGIDLNGFRFSTGIHVKF